MQREVSIAAFQAYVCSFKSGRGDLRVELGLTPDFFDQWSALAKTSGLTIWLVAYDTREDWEELELEGEELPTTRLSLVTPVQSFQPTPIDDWGTE